MWDTSNTYVDVAVQGGIASLAVFISVLVYGFKSVGISRKRSEVCDRRQAVAIWALGCALFANSVAFIGISYFDQTIVMWYALLAMLTTATSTRSPIVRQSTNENLDLSSRVPDELAVGVANSSPC
jgi:CDP-diglyceride synthetase